MLYNSAVNTYKANDFLKV